MLGAKLFEVVTQNHLLYLAPSLLISLTIRHLAKRSGVFGSGTIMMIGTFGHECLHFICGYLLLAKPVDIHLWPRKVDGGYCLGYVMFENLRWYNAVFVGMAPLLGFVAVFFYIDWRLALAPTYQFETSDLIAWFIISQVINSSWPSLQDFKISLLSWPIAAVAAGYAFWSGAWTV